jgi:hypothetical protein
MIRAYNREFQTDSPLDVELYMFRTETGPARTSHFRRIVSELWPDFTWYSWADEQAEALCEYEVSGFTSGASSSKSDIMAKFALVSWFANPVNTLVIVCSTSAKDSKSRIFGHITRDWRKARAAKKAIGNLIESQSIIRLSEKTDAFAASDNASICLVAAGSEFTNDALKRLEGRKAPHVILLIDELMDCSETIISTALWNLSANTKFEVHAAGNASSRYDPHGTFCAPITGWNSINRKTHRWPIKVGLKTGIAIHFDGTADDAPNMQRFAQGIVQLPFLRKAEDCLAARTLLGESNPVFLRQFAGWWPEDGEVSYIVTDAALASHDAYDRAEWAHAPTILAGIDPSYSSDGDRFIMAIGRYGLTVQGVWVIECHELIHIKPVPIPGETKDFAAIRTCQQIAKERNISPRHIGMDASAGTPLLSIAHQQWSPDILAVPFGGAATDLPISTFDKRIASDVYANATSELAYVFVEFLNAGQIRGIKPDHARELTARKFEIAAGGKIKIEKKADVKKRLGFSPDLADAFHICLRVLRERLRVQAGKDSEQSRQTGRDWKDLQRRRDVVSQTDGHRHADSNDPVEAAHRALAAARPWPMRMRR